MDNELLFFFGGFLVGGRSLHKGRTDGGLDRSAVEFGGDISVPSGITARPATHFEQMELKVCIEKSRSFTGQVSSSRGQHHLDKLLVLVLLLATRIVFIYVAQFFGFRDHISWQKSSSEKMLRKDLFRHLHHNQYSRLSFWYDKWLHTCSAASYISLPLFTQ
jgi:hypothetical protein